MENAMKCSRLALLVVGSVVASWSLAQAGDTSPTGMPWFFQGMPDAAQQAAWDLNKAIYGPDTAIPPKYQQLIALAVAAQIPCQYCIYAHTLGAKHAGATEAQIKEAIGAAALVRKWSTELNGNQLDMADFKKQVDAIYAGAKTQ